MAAPREVPILLGIFATLAAVGVHLAGRLEASPGALPVPQARSPSAMDLALGVGVALAGVAAVGSQLRATRRRAATHAASGPAPGAGPPANGGTAPAARALGRRAVLVMSLWTCLFIPALMYMLRRPPSETLQFVGPCALLLLPVRVYLRHGAGESEWVPWLVGLAAVALVTTGAWWSVAGPLTVALVCYGCALRDERRRRASA